MRAYVFTDKALTRQAGRFVWLSIDTEKQGSAGFLKKFPVNTWPSFFIIDPRSEKAVLRWVGSATVVQLSKLFEDGQRAYRNSAKGPERALARADALAAGGKNSDAIREYRNAIALAGANWPDYRRTVESLLFVLQSSGDNDGCARTARETFPKMGHTASAADVASTGLTCALDLPGDAPERKELVATLRSFSEEVLADSQIAMAADDRSGVYQALISEREDAKDEAGRRKLLEEWSTFLDGEAAKAKNPEERAVFDSHRLSAYIELGEPQRAVPMLEASERDLPGDYNPPARLAVAYKEMKDYPAALAASDRALAKAYGPRKIGILRTRAEIYQGEGDKETARKTLEQAIAYAESLPEEQVPPAMTERLRKKLAELN
jgi:tetratricopeptide (TPR) repeat protein